MDVLYRAEATAWGGREGRVASSDGVLDLQLAIPKEMGGPGGALTNPGAVRRWVRGVLPQCPEAGGVPAPP
jgi:organic hydroperoxide reductase OsmC/OhrA